MNRIYVIGAGGHAKVVIRTLKEVGFEIESVLDDDANKSGTMIEDIPAESPISKLAKLELRNAVIAIGENHIRKEIAEKYGDIDWQTAIHPRAYVDPSVKIGRGTVVFAGAIIQSGAVIGDHCIVNTGAIVDHDCVIGNYVHVAPGCSLGGNVSIDEGVFCGIGSCVIPGIKLEKWARVGAGAAVVGDVPAGKTVVGVPAKPVK